jgi:hypothetical protein
MCLSFRRGLPALSDVPFQLFSAKTDTFDGIRLEEI